MTIGEVGVDNSDLSYTGETGDSAFSMQYYRNKATEFQQVLNQLDVAARAAQRIIDLTYDSYDFQENSGIAGELRVKLEEFDSRKSLLKGTAEAINAGAAVVNYVGGRFPQLSVPQSLGAVNFPIAAIAAVAAAAGLITWGVTWVGDVTSIVQRYITTDAIVDPAVKDKVLAELAVMDAARLQSTESPITALAGSVKWIVFAGIALLAYRAYMQHKGK